MIKPARKIMYKSKIAAYRFFHTSLGKVILKAMSVFVSAKNLQKSHGSSKNPFIVCMTIDTESGYLKKNDERVWQYASPRSYIGYYKGIENWRNILNKYGAKGTFFLSTNCFSSQGKERILIMKQLRLLIKEGHEIGLHLHPDSDLAIQKMLGKMFMYTSSKFYTEKDISQMIAAGKKLIQENLNVNPIIFRWGNWALSDKATGPLEKNGFLIDSSATPGIKGHQKDLMSYDWSKAKSCYPWRINRKSYQETVNGRSKIMEVPIATFDFLGMGMRADPSYPVLIDSCFDAYYKHADRSKEPFYFVVISHSIEGVYEDGSKTRVLKVAEEFLKHCSKFNDVKFATISHFLDATRK